MKRALFLAILMTLTSANAFADETKQEAKQEEKSFWSQVTDTATGFSKKLAVASWDAAKATFQQEALRPTGSNRINRYGNGGTRRTCRNGTTVLPGATVRTVCK